MRTFLNKSSFLVAWVALTLALVGCKAAKELQGYIGEGSSSPSASVLESLVIGESGVSTALVKGDTLSQDVFMAVPFGGPTLDFPNGSPAFTLVGDQNIAISKHSNSGALRWSYHLASTVAGESVEPERLAVDGAGNLYLSGRYTGTLEVLSSTGSLLATLTSVGGVDLFVVRIDADGTFAWTRGLGTTNGNDRWIASTDSLLPHQESGANYSVLAIGYFRSSSLQVRDTSGTQLSLLTNAGNDDLFVIKLAQDGSIAFARRFGGSQNDRNTLTESPTIKIAANKISIAMNVGCINSNCEVVDGTGATVGSLYGSGAGVQGGLYNLNVTTGAFLWGAIARASGFSWSQAQALDVTTGGRVAVSFAYGSGGAVHFDNSDGGTQIVTMPAVSGTGDCVIVSFTSAGVVEWSAVVQGPGDDWMYLSQFDSSGNLIFGGGGDGGVSILIGGSPVLVSSSASAGSGDGLLAKISAAGTLVWGRTFDYMFWNNSIRVDSQGDVYQAALFEGTLRIGDEADATLLSVTSTDQNAFLIKFDGDDGSIAWFRRIASANGNTLPVFEVYDDAPILVGGFLGASVVIHDPVAIQDLATISAPDAEEGFYTMRFSAAGALDWAYVVDGPSVAGFQIDTAPAVRALHNAASTSVFLNTSYSADLRVRNAANTLVHSASISTAMQNVFFASVNKASGAWENDANAAGSDFESIQDIALDSSGHAVLLGLSSSADLTLNGTAHAITPTRSGWFLWSPF